MAIVCARMLARGVLPFPFLVWPMILRPGPLRQL